MHLKWWGLGATLAWLGAMMSCTYTLAPSQGGGEIPPTPEKPKSPSDIALPDGYAITKIASGLNMPTGIAFDEQGTAYVIEAGYSYGETVATPRLLRIEPDGTSTVIASGGKNGPWNGVAYAQNALFVAEGGEFEGGRILRIGLDGSITALVSGLPSIGDHHTNGPVVGADGYLYFGQGTATNSGVVGEDSAFFGWLKRHPEFHDIPCKDITLAGANYKTKNVLTGQGEVETGAYVPFGTPTTPGQVIPGKVPCTGAVMRVPIAGGPIELVAWGFRNPFGLAFSPQNELYITENGFDERGSRPIFGSGDILWRVDPGAWYGWPDYSGGRSVSTRRFKPPLKETPRQLLQLEPAAPPRATAFFGVHASANGFDFSRNPAFGHVGDAFVAQFGDMAGDPGTGKVLGPIGFNVVRVDVSNGVIHEFATNFGRKPGPASKLKTGGLERPVAARFDRDGAALYVVDFGVLRMTDKGPNAEQNTGVLWKIMRAGEQ